MKRLIPAALIAVALSGCATPVSHVNVPMSTYDKDTEYNIQENENGFGITVFYSRFQFMPESDALLQNCKGQLTAIAWEHSDNVGREIEPVNEQRIRTSMGRNIASGITSCQANAIVKYKK